MSDVAAIDSLVKKFEDLKAEIGNVIIGQEQAVNYVLLAIFCGGHSLLIGVPGLAKTLLVHTVSDALGLNFKRIQFTPDLMPSDILGSEILNKEREFTFLKGPIFSNIILADEINRTPPKTQAALLEAMQEKSVTIAGHHYKLDLPFLVLATQNPIEQEGTYPLPEAQLDRFMMKIDVDYPDFEAEKGADLLKWVIDNHDDNIDSYNEKNEEVLTRYTVYNEGLVDTYKKLLENLQAGENKHSLSLEYDWKTNLYK